LQKSEIMAFGTHFESEGREKPVFVYSTSSRTSSGPDYPKGFMYFGILGGMKHGQTTINLHSSALGGGDTRELETVSVSAAPIGFSAKVRELP
jgi:hypothetical protein